MSEYISREVLKKPDWLKVKFQEGPNFSLIDRYHREKGLHSVCRSAACPNQGECWAKGTATFMILGNHCTRNCKFCSVQHAQPLPVDPTEPEKVAAAISDLGLKHAVITSVTRDDLQDGGAAMFAELTCVIRNKLPQCRVELLIPDFGGNRDALETVLSARPDILGHNMETVPRLYPSIRSGASYERSLRLLAHSIHLNPDIPTKTSIMLGMGETLEEILSVMNDLRSIGCTLLTLGQYLAPSRDHHPVLRFVPPEEFSALQDEGLKRGFRHVEAGPLVRSSYHAEEQFGGAWHAQK